MQTIRLPAHMVCIALAAGLWHATSTGQTPIYRCGDTYSERPCAGAAALALQDTRTPAQRAEANAVARRLDQHASQLEKERHTLEKDAPRQAVVIGRTPDAAVAPRPAAKSPKPHGAKAAPEYFTASAGNAKTSPGSQKKKKTKKTATE